MKGQLQFLAGDIKFDNVVTVIFIINSAFNIYFCYCKQIPMNVFSVTVGVNSKSFKDKVTPNVL